MTACQLQQEVARAQENTPISLTYSLPQTICILYVLQLKRAGSGDGCMGYADRAWKGGVSARVHAVLESALKRLP